LNSKCGFFPKRPSRTSSASISQRRFPAFLISICAIFGASQACANSCPTAKDDIDTDRPDVTNSAVVVPVGSLQIENGVNLSARDAGRGVDGTNTRARLGIVPCLELLVDLPSYVGNVRAPGNSGFTDVAPGIKWQISPIPGQFDLSFASGVALPTGSVDIAGRGAQPYVQFPWAVELHDGWGISGMLTEFFRPSDPTSKRTTEATFVLEKSLTEKFKLFTEYVGDYPDGAVPTQLWNSGGLYQLSPTQQVDFHIAFGLNHNSPAYIVGVGYSFRFDHLFAGMRN
jgi:Putative MetA-pathway of phenol degradation